MGNTPPDKLVQFIKSRLYPAEVYGQYPAPYIKAYQVRDHLVPQVCSIPYYASLACMDVRHDAYPGAFKYGKITELLYLAVGSLIDVIVEHYGRVVLASDFHNYVSRES